MRITRDLLIKTARNAVAIKTQQDRHVICVYLTGSLMEAEPLLGGVTDIDLVFVHDGEPQREREIERVTDEIHLDILHLDQSVFNQPRSLRQDPWIGPFLCLGPLVLHDSHHWFEFTQASVCAQFNRPEYVLQRSRPWADAARQIWFRLHQGDIRPEIAWVTAYLDLLEKAANAVALLSGTPLTERRFLLDLPHRVQAVGRPGLAAGFAALIGSANLTPESWQKWLPEWTAVLKTASQQPSAPPSLHACRVDYTTHAAAAVFPEFPYASLWMLLKSWTRAEACLNAASISPSFSSVLQDLNFDESSHEERISSLDAFLDQVEETLDVWAHENGV